MSRRTERILIVLVGVLALVLFAGSFTFDMSATASVPLWYWLLMALLIANLLVLAVVRGLRSTPARSEVITNLVTAAVFLLVYTQATEGSVTRLASMVLALYFLAISGIRFILLVGQKASPQR
jgi:hypothetical protein